MSDTKQLTKARVGRPRKHPESFVVIVGFCKRCGVVGEFYGARHSECKECAKKRGKVLRSERSKIWRIERVCACGTKFLPHDIRQRWCASNRSCPAYRDWSNAKHRANGTRYRNKDKARQKEMRRKNHGDALLSNPIHVRAQMMVMQLRWGRGGGWKLDALLRPFIGTPCRWCGETLTLKNVSLDHRQPLLRSKMTKYTKEEVTKLNSADNITFICQKCNRTKSAIPEDKYQKLLDWLKFDPELEMLILQRLRKSNLMWSNRK